MSILPPGSDPMYGIFASLKDIDGKYESRYKIIGEFSGMKPNSFCRYYESNISTFFAYSNKVKIVFKYPIKITNYSFVLSQGHSYSHTWELYGIDRNGEHIVDNQTNLNLCDRAEYCNDDTLANKIYQIKVANPGFFRQYTFKSGNTSRVLKYFQLRSMDFFGISDPSFINTCQIF